jgi:hypothetical protein
VDTFIILPEYQCSGYVMNREKSEAKFICIHDCHAFKMDLWCAGLFKSNFQNVINFWWVAKLVPENDLYHGQDYAGLQTNGHILKDERIWCRLRHIPGWILLFYYFKSNFQNAIIFWVAGKTSSRK